MQRLSMFALVVTFTGLCIAGCQANKKPAESSLVTTDQGVMCTKCQTTWVKQPITTGGGKPHVVGYTSRKTHVCPDCQTAVNSFFATGKLEPTCKTCGDAMQICETHH